MDKPKLAKGKYSPRPYPTGLIASSRARRLFTEEQVRDIRKRLDAGQTQVSIAKLFDTDQAIISLIWRRQTYADVI